jgi:hypothetical protein
MARTKAVFAVCNLDAMLLLAYYKTWQITMHLPAFIKTPGSDGYVPANRLT